MLWYSVAALVLAPWLLFAASYYGTVIPNTVFAKAAAYNVHIPGFRRNLLYTLNQFAPWSSLPPEFLFNLAQCHRALDDPSPGEGFDHAGERDEIFREGHADRGQTDLDDDPQDRAKPEAARDRPARGRDEEIERRDGDVARGLEPAGGRHAGPVGARAAPARGDLGEPVEQEQRPGGAEPDQRIVEEHRVAPLWSVDGRR